MRNSANFFVGFLITFIGLAALAGSADMAIQILGASIICTAGISLAIWLPIWWVVGYIITGIFLHLFPPTDWRRREAPVFLSGQRRSLTPTQKALADYTINARAKGMSDTQIGSRLAALGWTEEEIELAQRIASERQ